MCPRNVLILAMASPAAWVLANGILVRRRLVTYLL